MLSIIQRYLVSEVLKSSVATTLILFVIFMSNSLGRLLSDISDGKIPAEALFPVLLGQSVDVFAMLLPLGFFLGIVFALGRLYKDHELIVMHACGLGYRHLYRVVLILLFPVLLISLICSLWLSAEMQLRARRVVNDLENVHEFTQMKVGQFNINKNSDQVFFMQSMSPDRMEIHDVVITAQGKETDTIETAEKGRHKLDPESGDLFLELGPGKQYQGSAGDANYNVIEFDRHGILLQKKTVVAGYIRTFEKPLSDILASSTIKDKTEFWWRLSQSISLVVLAMLAVPLSYIAPRQGRYGKIGFALLIFVVYLNLLGVTKSALLGENINMTINYWGVHALFIMMTLWLLKRRTHSSLMFWRSQQT